MVDKRNELEKSGSTAAQTAWVYRLSKPELLTKLAEFFSEINEGATYEELRKLLVQIVKLQARGKGTPAEQETTQQAITMTPGNNNKNILLKFDLDEDDWEIFVKRLEFYFTACDIPEDKKPAVLLTRLEVNPYNLLRNLAAPKKLKELKFDELVKLMQNHVSPPPSEVAERAKFAILTQGQGKSIADFVAELRLAARYCEFSNNGEKLRDQFISGIRDKAAKVELYKQKPKTFNEAVTQATSFEAANNNAGTPIGKQASAAVVYIVRLSVLFRVQCFP